MYAFALLVAYSQILSIIHEGFAQPRVVGGVDAPPRYRRNVALLRLSFQYGQKASCTATVLRRRWLLTAAHCIIGASVLPPINKRRSYALVDETDPRATAKGGSIPFYFKHVFVHAKFRRGTSDFRHDIALIQLRRNIPLHKYFPVRLGAPPRSETKVLAVGYGTTGETLQLPTAVQMTNVVVKDLRACARKENRQVRSFLRASRTVCAVSVGYPDRGETDTCYGDSGGPLLRKIGRRSVQFGITSFATGMCGEPGGRAYYTRVDRYKSLIMKMIKKGEGQNVWVRV